MLSKNKKLKLLKCFESLNIDSNNENQESIDEIIKEDKNFLLNFFLKQPYYKEMMPKIQKDSRGTLYYKGLIKKGLHNKSAFFQAIMKAIRNIKEEKIKSPRVKKELGLYKLSKIKELKIKKDKIDNIEIKKIKLIQSENEKLNKYKEQIKKQFPYTTINSNFSKKIKKINSSSSSINFFNNSNIYSIDNTNNSFYKNGSSTGKISQYSMITPNNNDISTYYKSNNFKKISRNESFLNKLKTNSNFNNNNLKYLVNKCIEEITTGKEVKGNVSNYNRKISRNIHKKLKTNKIENKDKKVIEEHKKKNKYIKLEEKNYANIKRKLNQKISNSLAYQNRKELIKLLKSNKNAESYILHLKEMNKINKIMDKRRIIERKTINKVKSLCILGYKKNEYLNKEMNKINSKNNELNKLNKTIDYNINDDFYLSNNQINKQNYFAQGGLLPKLFSFKDENLYKITLNN